jgi:hypothetical protein
VFYQLVITTENHVYYDFDVSGVVDGVLRHSQFFVAVWSDS